MGYAVVGVNVRGTGCSGGAYDFFETMQVLDGYDVIETVAAQDWAAGHQVGMVGPLLPRHLPQLFVAQSRPPSLSAITPLSVFGDTGTGVLRPGGLLNTGFAVSWADQVLANAEPLRHAVGAPGHRRRRRHLRRQPAAPAPERRRRAEGPRQPLLHR